MMAVDERLYQPPSYVELEYTSRWRVGTTANEKPTANEKTNRDDTNESVRLNYHDTILLQSSTYNRV